KSEQVHKYNDRWCVLFPSFLLYYKSEISPGKKKDLAEVNHPMGTIHLKNYHLRVRKDRKKCDFTLVPHKTAITYGFAMQDMKVRFRCQNSAILNDWINALRKSVEAATTGYITYGYTNKSLYMYTYIYIYIYIYVYICAGSYVAFVCLFFRLEEVRDKFLGDELGGVSMTANEENKQRQEQNSGDVSGHAKNGENRDKDADVAPSQQQHWSLDDDTPFETTDSNKVTKKIITIEDVRKMIDDKQSTEDKLKVKENQLLSMKNELEQVEQRLQSQMDELKLKKEAHTKELNDLENKLRESEEQRKESSQICSNLNKDIIAKEAAIRDLQVKVHKQEENNQTFQSYAVTMEQWNVRLRKMTMDELHRINPNFHITKLIEICAKSCQQTRQELSHLYDEHTFPLVYIYICIYIYIYIYIFFFLDKKSFCVCYNSNSQFHLVILLSPIFKSTLIGRVMENYKSLAGYYVNIVEKDAQLEGEMDEMKTEMEKNARVYL
ncbi:hypothetical protein RFI_22615, partial [Reticulomyxa filosa]